jgi:predicted tellurium resistance membrane protein TerC
MRFAAFGFIRLLEKFPRFELSGYLMVAVVGSKLTLDYFFNAHHERLNFESPSAPAFWIFWVLMAISFAIGFAPTKKA